MPVLFPYLSMTSDGGDASLMPMLPLDLQFQNSAPIQALGMLDSGATVNVLPYSLGVRLGAVWDAQTTRVTLTGNLARQEARALLVQARIAHFAAVPLVFAWTRAEHLPLLLGQMNFFGQFDVCFHRTRRQFELEPARK